MTASIYESFPDSSTAIVSEKNSEGKGEHLVDPQEGAAGQRRPVFLRRDHVGAFLSIVLSGQLVYAAFEALKGSLMLQISDVLGIGIDGFGAMMSVIGLAMYMYIPAGWINHRFTIRSIVVRLEAGDAYGALPRSGPAVHDDARHRVLLGGLGRHRVAGGGQWPHLHLPR